MLQTDKAGIRNYLSLSIKHQPIVSSQLDLPAKRERDPRRLRRPIEIDHGISYQERSMEDDLEAKHPSSVRLTVHVVGSYVTNNHVQPTEIPRLLNAVHAAIQAEARGCTSSAVAPPAAKPSRAEVKRSVSRDALISFEDGKRYKTLKRHLATRGLTPERYREKWGLPKDYPMVAPDYAERRSALAKAMGLGRPAHRVSHRAAPVMRKGPRRGGPKRAA
jgi:predicted transcriptional regulator